MSLLPTEDELRRLILTQTNLTAKKLETEIKNLQNIPMLKNKPAIVLTIIAKKHKVEVPVQYAEGSDFEGQGEDEYLPLGEVLTTDLKSFNVRGVVMRVTDEIVSKETGKVRRMIDLADESGIQSFAIYGELMDEIKHYKPDDIIKLEGVSVFKIPTTNRLWPMTGKWSGLTKIKWGDLGLESNALYKLPTESLTDVRERAKEDPADYYPVIRGYFSDRSEDGEPTAVCPNCRGAIRGAKIGRPAHCKKCEDNIYTVEHRTAKFVFWDEHSSEPVTAIPARSSGIDPDEIELFDPPEVWPMYLLEGRMNKDGERFFILRYLKLPALSDADYQDTLQLDDVEEPEDPSPTDAQLADASKDIIKKQWTQEDQIALEASLKVLDFSCDEKDVIDPTTIEIQMAIDLWDEQISLWGSMDPSQLQTILTNMLHKERGGEKVYYRMRPIVGALIEEDIAKIDRDKLVAI